MTIRGPGPNSHSKTAAVLSGYLPLTGGPKIPISVVYLKVRFAGLLGSPQVTMRKQNDA